ncbi:MAG: Fic family protein [Spirochaetaceae bacterium]|nr:Fic family protein [Spirochaetaceae bacterium]
MIKNKCMEEYIWQNNKWPHFTWEPQKLISPLLEVHTNQGILEGQMRSLGFAVQSETTLRRFTQEIQKSFEIEGENVSDYSLRSSIARHLGIERIILASDGQLDKPRPRIDAIVDVITDAVHNCHTPLSIARLFQWHRKLFPQNANGMAFNGIYTIRTGQLRTDEEGPMRVISGTGKNYTVHFQAPPAEILQKEMEMFLKWFNYSDTETHINSVIKSAIAHLYFVTLHPFEDGNGRLARAIADMALCRGDNFDHNDVWVVGEATPSYGQELRFDHLYSMSAQLCKERHDYYAQLEHAQKQSSMDITEWLLWYIGCMNRAILNVLKEIAESQARKQFWEYAETCDINDRQRKILTMLLDDFQGKLTSTKYAKICKCSQDTATRDIEKLITARIIRKGEAGGRSTSYELISKL